MAKVTCAISGLTFTVPYLECIVIPHTCGYMHPIFAAPYKHLYKVYSAHCKGRLTPTDSYLLFLAFMHATDKVDWECPVSLDPNALETMQLIESLLPDLIRMLEQTDAILHPSFSQPSLRVTYETAGLAHISGWIEAWSDNIAFFYTGRANLDEMDKLKKIENRLSYLILSGKEPAKYAGVIADWADKTASFPPERATLYKETICSCFSINKMFNTPLELLKEIKEFCEINIPVGSIHFHSLMQVLKDGIGRHLDYLGGSSLATGYTLLPSCEVETSTLEAEKKNTEQLVSIAASAPSKRPVAGDYATSLEFLRAKLAYSVAAQAQSKQALKVAGKEV